MARAIQLRKYMELDQKDKIMVEYIWIDADGGVRSKSRASSYPLNCLRLIMANIKRAPFRH